MSRGFLLFLLLTGVLSMILIGMPGLVMAGLMVLIVPGLIMMAIPTVFLWSLTYAMLWFPIRWAFSDFAAMAGATLAALALLIGIPFSFNAALNAWIAAESTGDRSAGTPIALRGLIELRAPFLYVGEGMFRRPSCDLVCHSILYTPGVEGVVLVDISGDKRASAPVLLKLEKRASGCASEESSGASLSEEWGQGPAGERLTRTWLTRQSEGECIVRRLASPNVDFRITLQVRNGGRNNANWRLFAPTPSLRRLAIERVRGGKAELLLQRSFAWSRPLFLPLTILAEGGLSDFRFGWGRRNAVSYAGRGHFVPIELLRGQTNIGSQADGKSGDSLRQHLAAAMKDPKRAKGDAGFALAPAVFEDIVRNGPRGDDRALVVAMVADTRVVEFHRLWDVSRRFDDGLAELRPVIVARLLATPTGYDASDAAPSILGSWLKSLDGAFTMLTAEEERLLADHDRRKWADGLVRRMSDRGAAAAPALAELIADREVREAAAGALCALGPRAAPVLPQVEARMGSHLRDDRRGQIMLARLGKPIGSFRSPPNHSWSDKQLQESLRTRLARFDVKRDCD
ncbi:hypothetical protein Q9Q95_06205 [Sphingomonas sp. DG1-23]|uniref:hypothetical protein n=1 Tax=Sphingomonas sp. DG1-23 TaxID=3068316 RepID=UPI00273DDA71|nr:hypothetical protein [Sphingomonas sp. DG1-23]MDP5278511.1 hypothetical protein [Sphingomonas sp. DG1-23]